MIDPVQHALDSVTNAIDVDWTALEAEASDEATVRTLRALRDIAAIARAYDAAPAPPRPQVPFTWGPLHVRGYIARGAHGDVYRAWDPRLEREVALKLLGHDAIDHVEAPIAIHEGRLLARVRHPNVVAVYGADRINGQAGIWMELVDGSTLRHIVEANGPAAPDEAIQIGAAISSGLAAVHAAGLVHRDVKAQNVVRDCDGRTILMDLSAGIESANADGRLEGTPMYLAPEVLDGSRASVASDIYALGVLLFFLVTGRYPVTATSIDDLRRRHRTGERERLGGNPSVPAALSAVIDRALSVRPEDRFQSAEDIRAALERAQRPSSRWYWAATAAVVTAIATTLVAGITVLRTDGARAPSAGVGDDNTEAKPRKVRVPSYPMGVPSRDGRFIPYVDANGHLHIWEVATARAIRIVSADDSAGAARTAAMSPDADRVAYMWRLPDGSHELMVVNADGTWPRVVIGRQTAYEPAPLDWSDDGRTILCLLVQRNGTSDLVLVAAEGGPPTLLRSFPGGASVDASLSPDARYVVVAARTRDQTETGLLLLDAAAPEQLVPIAGSEGATFPRWLPDGAHVFFVRAEGEETAHGWVVPIAGGEPQGAPTIALSNFGFALQAVVTRSGAIYRITHSRSADVYTAAFDPAGASPPGPPTRVSRSQIGNRVGPAWSPDGRLLAYFATQQIDIVGRNPLRTLMVQDMASGETRQVPVRLAFLGGYSPRWSPDGRTVTVWGRDGDRIEDFGYFRVDIISGDTTEVVTIGTNAPAFSQYSPDGSEFWYVHPQRGLVVRHLSTGDEQILARNDRGSSLGRFFLAPNGHSVAFIRYRGAWETQVTTLEMQPRDGQPRQLVRAEAPTRLDLQGWTLDGEYLLYSRGINADPYSLWRIAVKGGEPVNMNWSVNPGPNGISLSPDGRRIAYPERTELTELIVTPLASPARAR